MDKLLTSMRFLGLLIMAGLALVDATGASITEANSTNANAKKYCKEDFIQSCESLGVPGSFKDITPHGRAYLMKNSSCGTIHFWTKACTCNNVSLVPAIAGTEYAKAHCFHRGKRTGYLTSYCARLDKASAACPEASHIIQDDYTGPYQRCRSAGVAKFTEPQSCSSFCIDQVTHGSLEGKYLQHACNLHPECAICDRCQKIAKQGLMISRLDSTETQEELIEGSQGRRLLAIEDGTAGCSEECKETFEGITDKQEMLQTCKDLIDPDFYGMPECKVCPECAGLKDAKNSPVPAPPPAAASGSDPFCPETCSGAKMWDPNWCKRPGCAIVCAECEKPKKAPPECLTPPPPPIMASAYVPPPVPAPQASIPASCPYTDDPWTVATRFKGYKFSKNGVKELLDTLASWPAPTEAGNLFVVNESSTKWKSNGTDVFSVLPQISNLTTNKFAMHGLLCDGKTRDPKTLRFFQLVEQLEIAANKFSLWNHDKWCKKSPAETDYEFENRQQDMDENRAVKYKTLCSSQTSPPSAHYGERASFGQNMTYEEVGGKARQADWKDQAVGNNRPIGTPNCCARNCGRGTQFGNFPVMADHDAVQLAQETFNLLPTLPGPYQTDFNKAATQVKKSGPQCKCQIPPGGVPPGAHLLRITPCWMEHMKDSFELDPSLRFRPGCGPVLCILVKITTGGKNLVDGWSEVIVPNFGGNKCNDRASEERTELGSSDHDTNQERTKLGSSDVTKTTEADLQLSPFAKTTEADKAVQFTMKNVIKYAETIAREAVAAMRFRLGQEMLAAKKIG